MKKQLLLLIVPFILSGCVNNGITPGPKEEEYDLTYKYEDLASDPDFEPISEKCSLGGWFSEIGTNRCLATNSRYEFKFNATSSLLPGLTAKSSNTTHAVVELGDDNSTFYLNTLTAGDTILSVYNGDGYLCYRNVVRIRPAQEQEDVLSVACGADHFESLPMITAFTGMWKYTLLDNERGQSIISGSDEMETNFRATFELEFDYYVDSTELYCFKCVNQEDYTANTYISLIAFSKVCDVAYVYYTSGSMSSDEHLLTILYNSDVEYIYKNNSK